VNPQSEEPIAVVPHDGICGSPGGVTSRGDLTWTIAHKQSIAPNQLPEAASPSAGPSRQPERPSGLQRLERGVDGAFTQRRRSCLRGMGGHGVADHPNGGGCA
jgi:hypothetical protein